MGIHGTLQVPEGEEEQGAGWADGSNDPDLRHTGQGSGEGFGLNSDLWCNGCQVGAIDHNICHWDRSATSNKSNQIVSIAMHLYRDILVNPSCTMAGLASLNSSKQNIIKIVASRSGKLYRLLDTLACVMTCWIMVHYDTLHTSALYGFVIVLMKHVRVFCFLCHGITGQSLDLVSKGMSILIIYHVICSFFT